MTDEPTLGEVVRRLEDVRRDLKDDVHDIGKRLDSKVDQQLYDLKHESLAGRVKTLEAQRREDANKLVATRRWVIGGVIIPLVGIVVPLIILIAGGGSS